MPETVTSIVVHLRSTLCQTVRYFREDFFEGPTLCRWETKASSFSAVVLIPLLLLRPSIEPEHTAPVPHQLSLAFSGWPQKNERTTNNSQKRTSLDKSAGTGHSWPSSALIPNCTPVIGIGTPTLYVNLSVKGKSRIRVDFHCRVILTCVRA